MPTAEDGAPGAFRFAEPGALARLLVDVGAAGVRERPLDFSIEAPISPEEFWVMRSETSGTLREKLAKLSEGERLRVAQEVQEAVSEFFLGDQMSFPARALGVMGKRPG
jgi:hypothetical protein